MRHSSLRLESVNIQTWTSIPFRLELQATKMMLSFVHMIKIHQIKLLHKTRKKVGMGVTLQVQLMDDGTIGPYARIIYVYTGVSVSGAKWMCHDGCGHCAYPGKAFIFVE